MWNISEQIERHTMLLTGKALYCKNTDYSLLDLHIQKFPIKLLVPNSRLTSCIYILSLSGFHLNESKATRRLKKMTFAEGKKNWVQEDIEKIKECSQKIRVQKMQNGCLGKFRITERCQLSSTLNGFGSMEHLQDWF